MFNSKCSMEDVASLYSTFDTRSSVRSTGDINLIYAAIVPELAEISPWIINSTVTGIAFSIWEAGYYSRPSEERAQLIISGAPFAIWLSDLVTGKDNRKYKHIRRSPVVAAMYKTWCKAKGPATEFWTAVRDETGPKPDCPDRKLAKYLCSVALHSSRDSMGAAKKAGSREVYVKCLHGWNAWRKNESTSLSFFANAKTPSAL